MSITREKLYRFPWSKTDNSGGWVEVTGGANFRPKNPVHGISSKSVN
jgi:hypothetical protein